MDYKNPQFSYIENMKIAHFFAMSLEPISGSRTYLRNLVDEQSKHAKVTVLCRADKENTKIKQRVVPIKMYKFDSWRWYDLNLIQAKKSIASIKKCTFNFLNKNPIDIFNVHHITYSLYAAKVAKEQFNLPIVVTSHGTGIYQNHDDKNLMQILGEDVDKVIAVSKFLKRYIIKNSSFKQNKIKVIYPGVDCKTFNPSNYSNDLVKKYGKYALFFGRIEKEKGIPMIIDIAKNLPKDVKIIVAGKGKDTDLFIRSINEANLKKQIIYLGYLDDHTLSRFIASASSVLVPSIFADPFPIVPLESMASGTPVIVSKNGGLSELPNIPGVNKTKFVPEKFADSVIKSLEFDDYKKAKLVNTTQKLYSWTTISNKYFETYSRLLM